MKRGTYIKCPKCKGRGDGFLNHLNGETHCYRCDGTGLAYRQTSEEKALETAREQAFQGLHFASMHGPRKLNTPTVFMRAARTAEYPGRDADEATKAAYTAAREADYQVEQRLKRTTNFWIDEAVASVTADWAAEREAHKAAAYREARAKVAA